MYAGKEEEAQAELQKMADQARNDGELRTAYFGMAVIASDDGKYDKALQAMDKEYGVAQKSNDVMSMAADLQAKGNILAEIPRYDEAQRQFDHSFQMRQGLEPVPGNQGECETSTRIQPDRDCRLEERLRRSESSRRGISQGSGGYEEFGTNKTIARVSRKDCLRREGLCHGHRGAGTSQPAESPQPFSLEPGISGQRRCRQGSGLSYEGRRLQFAAGLNYAFIRVKARKLAAEKKAS